jgi:hypothetical protein
MPRSCDIISIAHPLERLSPSGEPIPFTGRRFPVAVNSCNVLYVVVTEVIRIT